MQFPEDYLKLACQNRKKNQHFTSIQRNLFLRHTMWLVLVYRQSLRGEQIHILDSANNPTIDDLAICLHCFRKQQNTITHGERSKSLSDFLPWYVITKLKHPFKPWIKKKLKISKHWEKKIITQNTRLSLSAKFYTAWWIFPCSGNEEIYNK